VTRLRVATRPARRACPRSREMIPPTRPPLLRPACPAQTRCRRRSAVRLPRDNLHWGIRCCAWASMLRPTANVRSATIRPSSNMAVRTHHADLRRWTLTRCNRALIPNSLALVSIVRSGRRIRRRVQPLHRQGLEQDGICRARSSNRIVARRCLLAHPSADRARLSPQVAL